MKNTLLTISTFLLMGNSLVFGGQAPQPQTVSSREMSLENRAMPGSYMNSVMGDNILLTIAYMRGIVKDPSSVDWEAVRKPFEYEFTLKPGETYAFQKDVLPEFKGTVVKTIGVNFGGQDGYKHDGYLMGDGVCHLASLFYWAAKDAGLHAVAPTNHDFMPIPEIPREYGVAIYSQPGDEATNSKQNLYVQNSTNMPITFKVAYDGREVKASILKDESGVQPENKTQEII